MAGNDHPLWTLPPEDVLAALESSAGGITPVEAQRRLRHYGRNELPEPPQRPLWLRFVDQLTHFMALLLWVAGILAFVARTPELGWAIWAVIWINAGFSFWQEYQAERALVALKQLLPSQVQVYRGGELCPLDAAELVRGDLLQLEEGMRVPADARLIQADNLSVDVSSLTGESLPVARSAAAVPVHADLPITGAQSQPERLAPSEISNLVLAGSTIVAGRGQAVVYATGAHTEFGHVAHLTTSVQREPGSLEQQISRIVRVITAIALGMGGLVFLLSVALIGLNLTESLIFAVGIIVANVPEGLLPTVTLALALGVQRMARRNALVRRLSAVEGLSATSVICTDKTGTLTQNEMTVHYLWLPTNSPPIAESATAQHAGQILAPALPPLLLPVSGTGYDPGTGSVDLPDQAQAGWQVQLLLTGAALCSNARLVHPTASSRWQEIGDPTEAALLVVATKAGLSAPALQARLPRRRELPFDSGRRMMTVVLDWSAAEVWRDGSSQIAFTKGAPLELLRHCQSLLVDGETLPLDRQQQETVIAANDGFAAGGLRVLGLAARRGGPELCALPPAELEQCLTFIGLLAMYDPPRPEVPVALQQCHQAGIKVTMVTGDYGLTAAAIARQIGLAANHVRVVTGEHLRRLSDAQVRQVLAYRRTPLFARMAPEDKLRLVQTYQRMGEIVAVTGDGINDAPALRAAAIGVAMGRNGTDVAREAADIVLTDDNFASISGAVEQGRGIYHNIRKFMTYILASNIPEIVPFLAMLLLGIPPALTILQILAVDLGTDMVPALALGAEAPEDDVMELPPERQRRPLLDLPLLVRAYGFLGLIEGSLAMLGFFLVWWSWDYTFSGLQALTPAILNHRATPEVMAVYAQATTMTLAVIVACQIGNLFACRSDHRSVFQLNWIGNRLLWLGILVECLVLLACIYVPVLSRVFQTAPLAGWQWLLLPLCPIILLGAEELRKLLLRRRRVMQRGSS